MMDSTDCLYYVLSDAVIFSWKILTNLMTLNDLERKFTPLSSEFRCCDQTAEARIMRFSLYKVDPSTLRELTAC